MTRPASRPSCLSFSRRISSRPSPAAKSCSCWKPNGAADAARSTRCPRDAPLPSRRRIRRLLTSWKSWPAARRPPSCKWRRRILRRLLPALAEHPNITLGKTSAVTVTQTPLQAAAARHAGGGRRNCPGPEGKDGAAGDDWAIGFGGNRRLQPLGLPPALAEVLRAPVRLPRAQVPQFLSQHWPQLQAAGGVEANFKLEDFTLEPQAPRFLLELQGGLAQLGALLQCAYGPRIMTVGVTAAGGRRLAAGSGSADALFHARFRRRKRGAGPVATQRLRRTGRARKTAIDRTKRGVEFLRARISQAATGMERDAGGTAGKQRGAEHRARPAAVSNHAPACNGLISAWCSRRAAGKHFPPADIQRLLLSGQSHTRLKNGKMGGD